MKLTFGILLTVAAVTFSGCTNRSRSVKVEDKPKTGESSKDSTQGNTTVDSANTASIETTIDGETLQSLALPLGIDVSKINTYSFSYLDVSRTGTFSLVGGVAKLKIDKLPSDRQGTVKLIFLQEGKPVLVGEAQNITLKAGQANSLTLVMRASGANDTVPASNPSGTTDLNIDVTVDPSVSGSSSSGTSTPASVLPTPAPAPAPIPTVTPAADPLPNWNGLEFKGNSRWKIVPVN